MNTWTQSKELTDFIAKKNQKNIGVYEIDNTRIKMDSRSEDIGKGGGYTYKQVIELVQNAADAIGENASLEKGKIVVTVKNNCLYVANTGETITQEGIEALMGAFISTKRGNQIGRFGIGFKSLLNVSDEILFASKNVSFKFDTLECQHEIKSKFPTYTDNEFPRLTQAFIVNIEEELKNDSQLEKLSEWATTIVRVKIRNIDDISRIDEEISSFNSAFLLFLESNFDLILEDSSGKIFRNLTRIKNSNTSVKLNDSGNEVVWRVFTTSVDIAEFSDDAKNDGDRLHTRDTFPIFWAFPDNEDEINATYFWSFFQTNTPNRIPGIVNAPWKIGADRSSLERGAFNNFLMKKAGKFIADTIEEIAKEKQPYTFDLLPRQHDNKDELSYPLIESIWQDLRNRAIILDGNNNLRDARSLKLPPLLPYDEILVPLTNYGNDNWRNSYPNILLLKNRERRARLNSFMALSYLNPKEYEVEYSSYFGNIEYDANSVEEYFNFIRSSFQTSPHYLYFFKNAKIILCANGEYRTPLESVYKNEFDVLGKYLVHEILQKNECIKSTLEKLGVIELCDEEIEKSILAITDIIPLENNIEKFWSELEKYPLNTVLSVIERNAKRFACVKIKNACGEYENPKLLFTNEDQQYKTDDGLKYYFIDDNTSQFRKEVTLVLGLSKCPNVDIVETKNYLKNDSYRRNTRNAFKTSNPQIATARTFDFSAVDFFKSISLLQELSDDINSELTELIFDKICRNPNLKNPAEITHSAAGSKVAPMKIFNPNLYGLYKYGLIKIGSTFAKIKEIVEILLANKEAISFYRKLEDRFDILCENLEKFYADHIFLHVKDSSSNLLATQKNLAQIFLESAVTKEYSSEQYFNLLREGCKYDVLPEKIKNLGDILTLSDCYICASHIEKEFAQKHGVNVILVPCDIYQKWIELGLNPLNTILKVNFEALNSHSSFLLSQYLSDLNFLLKSELLDKAKILECKEIQFSLHISDTSIQTEDVKAYYHKDYNLILIYMSEFEMLDDYEKSRILIQQMASADWLNTSFDNAVEELNNNRYKTRRDEVYNEPNLAQKLIRALNKKVEYIREILPAPALSALEATTYTEEDLAQVALNLYGPSILALLKDALDSEGLKPPSRWGTFEAYEFAKDLGFPKEFGGSPSKKRNSDEFVMGKFPLGELHDYQKNAIEKLNAFLLSSGDSKRAVLCLPTGAGKTRVASQFVVEEFLNKGKPVLWIAQTDELCEQAVQSFMQIWHNIGQFRSFLKISRFWGGQRNPILDDEDSANLVIASIQTFDRRKEQIVSLANKVGIVIIDEGHRSTSRSYTDLFKWLDVSNFNISPPVIALTATPYRSNEDESKSLAKRYNHTLIPDENEIKSIYKRLVENDVLAKATYEEFEGIDFALTAEELEYLKKFHQFPESSNQRLGNDEGRNERIVNKLEEYAKANKQVLFFANSVAHAQHISTLLSMRDITVGTVDSTSSSATRQYVIKKFQEGNIKILANYLVLTTGFDAPKTDVVFIARPIFSEVTLFQMIGRGLRGPKNGGTEYCTILTVKDNIADCPESYTIGKIQELWQTP